MALQYKTRHAGDVTGLKSSVQLGGENNHYYNPHNEYLQPIATPIRRVVTRLERRFSLSRAHARVVAELAFPGACHE